MAAAFYVQFSTSCTIMYMYVIQEAERYVKGTGDAGAKESQKNGKETGKAETTATEGGMERRLLG